jgi:hypothetical protein
MAKLEQKTVNAGCVAAQARFNAMSITEAKEQISYDMQGFLASMVERKEWNLPRGLLKLAELIDLIAKENGI